MSEMKDRHQQERTVTRKRRLALRQWLPPALEPFARRWVGAVRFSGDYSSWEQAMQDCEGYASDIILERVKAAALAVKRGEAASERDSVILEEPDYSWPVLASLLWVAQRRGKLRVLDFGGSLGSSYYANKKLLAHLDLIWGIVEQPHFIECGKAYFEDTQLRFFHDIADCVAAIQPNVVLLSGVVQCLPAPHEFLKELVAHDFDFLIFDRTPFHDRSSDRLCVQTVTEPVYPASYPAWFLARHSFMKDLEDRYTLVEEFEARDRANISSKYCGFIFERSSPK